MAKKLTRQDYEDMIRKDPDSIVASVIEGKIDPNMRVEGVPLLSLAINEDKSELAHRLIREGADVDAYASKPAAERGMAPIHFAKSAKSIALLAESNADINAPYTEVDHAWGMRGETALHTAALGSTPAHLEQARALIDNGANKFIPYSNKEFDYGSETTLAMSDRVVREGSSITSRLDQMSGSANTDIAPAANQPAAQIKSAEAESVERDAQLVAEFIDANNNVRGSQVEQNIEAAPQETRELLNDNQRLAEIDSAVDKKVSGVTAAPVKEIINEHNSAPLETAAEKFMILKGFDNEQDFKANVSVIIEPQHDYSQTLNSPEFPKLIDSVPQAGVGYRLADNEYQQIVAVHDSWEKTRAAINEMGLSHRDDITVLSATQGDKYLEQEKLPTMEIDAAALAQVSAKRAKDRAEFLDSQNGNKVEIAVGQEKIVSATASAWASKAKPVENESADIPNRKAADNSTDKNSPFKGSSEKVDSILPDDVKNYYLQVGSKFYQPNKKDMVAFEDRGNELRTKSDSANIAKSLVSIAEARGWQEIKASGSEAFRREVWMQAAERGIDVRGYKPNELDLAELEKRLPQNRVEKAAEQEKFRGGEKAATTENEHTAKSSPTADAVKDAKSNDTVTKPAEVDKPNNPPRGVGSTLLDHGHASFQFNVENGPSYFVKVLDNRNEERHFWGVDLERAIKESGAEIGDKISLYKEHDKDVTVEQKVRNAEGKVVGKETIQAQRNAWTVEITESLRNNSIEKAVAKFPELAGSAAILAATEKHASNLSEESRKAVLHQVRENLARSIEHGKIPTANIREEREAVSETRKTAKKEHQEHYERGM